MDTRSSAIRMVAALFLTVIFPSAGFSDPVHIYSVDFNLPIPSSNDPNSEYGMGWMADAVIEVPDNIIISDLDIGINVTHTSVFDLQIFLQSPDGSGICLNMYDPYDEFFVGANYTNTVFDDEAPIFIKEGEAPFIGRFRPVDELSEFTGENACGFWCMRIYDGRYSDIGNFNRFELMITAPEPATVMLLTLGSTLLGLFKPRRGH